MRHKNLEHRPGYDILDDALWPHLALSKSRIDTLCWLIIAMVSARTVNLSHLSREMPGEVRIASSYRRLQRFFQYVTLGSDWSARLIVRLLGLTGRQWYLCLDRTNWKIGTKDVNILMLALVTRRFRVPLMWSVLDKFGSSNTDERIALMRRYLALFEASSVRLLLADREFVGDKWLEFLHDHHIPFVIGLKQGALIRIEDGRVFPLHSFLRRCRAERRFSARLPDCNVALTFAAKRLKDGELLIVASNRSAHRGLNAYRKRWAIVLRQAQDEVPVRRCQNARPQHRGHAPDLPAKAQLSARPGRSRARLGQCGRIRGHGALRQAARKPWLLCQILVPHRLRRHPKSHPDKLRRRNEMLA